MVVHKSNQYFGKMIASLHDENNLLPWFYDNVEELSLEERAEMAKAPFSLENIKSTKPKRCLWRKGYVTNEEKLHSSTLT
jgi:hypothetical protein